MREPLTGFTVGLATGPGVVDPLDRRSGELCRALELAGAHVLAATVGVPTAAAPAEADSVAHLVNAAADRRLDALVLTTPAAIDAVDRAAEALGLGAAVTRALSSGDVVTICATPGGADPNDDRDPRRAASPVRSGVDAVVDVVERQLGPRIHEVELGGTAVRVQGRLAVIGDDDEAWLTLRERGILEILLERPGAVRSKRELLRRVWRGDESDEHVVEVTVARLRQRLGPAAAGIETVVRRGYRAAAVPRVV